MKPIIAILRVNQKERNSATERGKPDGIGDVASALA
jgi:hypothetical protein